MKYLRLDDEIFDHRVSLREAYAILEGFVMQYNARGESSTLSLMTDIGSSGSGTPSDPAQIYDFVAVAGAVLQDDKLLRIASPADRRG